MTQIQSRIFRVVLILFFMIIILGISSCSTLNTEEVKATLTIESATSTIELQPSPTFTIEIPTATETATATATLQPSPTPGGLHYFNDFNRSTTGLEEWTLYEIPFRRHDDTKSLNFPPVTKQGEEKQVIDALTSDPIYVIYDRHFYKNDSTFEAEFEIVGNGSATLGLIFRYSADGWYEMSVSNTGHWTINMAQMNSDEVIQTMLQEGDSQPLVSGQNTLTASCIDKTISISLNNEPLGSVEDSTLPDGDIFGLVYSEEAPFEMHAEISKIQLEDKDNKEFFDIDYERSGFYFNSPWWAVGTSTPKEVRSIMKGYSSQVIEDGQAKLTTSIPSWVVMINPQEMPRDVEINMDITTRDNVGRLGVGVICDWSDVNGGYIFWYRSPFTIITPYDIDSHGIPEYMGGDYEFVNTRYEELLAGETHHITANCGLGMVKFYIDGTLVESQPVSEFKYPDANKNGRLVGVAYYAEDINGANFFIDNYSVSWGLPLPTKTP